MKLTALLFKEQLKNMGSVSQGRRLYLQWVIVTGMVAAVNDHDCNVCCQMLHGRRVKLAGCGGPPLRRPAARVMSALHGRQVSGQMVALAREMVSPAGC